MYKVTVRCFRTVIFAVQKQQYYIFWVCVLNTNTIDGAVKLLNFILRHAKKNIGNSYIIDT